ncbi:CpXC domain-containing protein [Faecalicoccus acidiformans]|uniref:CpXC domain-containing protein n=1 Tax=Faecalicoccus acidiformans TaxID=915173 RepID=UPI0023548922|nr:CpXC domain-containing protein [Faecalicoccus acidiformans]
MKERMIEITCPVCGHVFQIKRDTLAIAGISDGIEKRLKDGTYFQHICSKCHHLFTMIYPFVFRNPQKKTSLVLSQQSTIKGFDQEEKVVRCKDADSFLLAYKALSQNLNLSFLIRKQKQFRSIWPSVIFDNYDLDHHCLWVQVHGEWKACCLTKEEEQELKTIV